ncbi:unnamed protein product [Hymenolepis diminuta]|uniref:Uncharacterized protein n=1 Tax=Hymenolepis diminuta TaxID=6216 RepID=A0A3P6WVZ5_HYMDI|nr:unnamed protein product [Hymenolepis diminuta]
MALGSMIGPPIRLISWTSGGQRLSGESGFTEGKSPATQRSPKIGEAGRIPPTPVTAPSWKFCRMRPLESGGAGIKGEADRSIR